MDSPETLFGLPIVEVEGLAPPDFEPPVLSAPLPLVVAEPNVN